MKRKVNKVCFVRIHKKTISQNQDFIRILKPEVVKNTERIDSIERTIESLDELNNLILSHKIQINHIKNNPILKKFKDFKL